ncbi:MAG: arginase family protein [Thermomicrobiales bacterium]
MPTDRILMIDVRNLDDREETLIRATDVTIARFGHNGETGDILAAIDALAAKVDYLYLHIDSDILDERFQPNHPTAEPNGPDDKTVDHLIEHVSPLVLVVALAAVKINPIPRAASASRSSASSTGTAPPTTISSSPPRCELLAIPIPNVPISSVSSTVSPSSSSSSKRSPNPPKTPTTTTCATTRPPSPSSSGTTPSSSSPTVTNPASERRPPNGSTSPNSAAVPAPNGPLHQVRLE